MRSLWMAVAGAAALVGCASSGESNRPVNPQSPPTMTHQAQPVGGTAAPGQGATSAGFGPTTSVVVEQPKPGATTAPSGAAAQPGTTAAQTGATPAPPSPTAQPGASTAQGAATGMEAICPMTVPGTKVKAQDTSLVFTTTASNVAEVQRRVKEMAQMHNQHAGAMGKGGKTSQGPGMMRGMGMGMTAPEHAALMGAKVRAENLPNGARLVFTPKDPAQLPALRTALAKHAQKMASGQCGMMGMHGQGMAPPPPGQPAHPPASTP